MRSPRVTKVVKLPNAVVVAARDYWSAKKGLATLEPVWRAPPGEPMSSPAIMQRLRELTRSEGTAYLAEGENEAAVRSRCAEGLAKAVRVIERTYEAPLLSHSPMEPMNGTASVRDGRAELWLEPGIWRYDLGSGGGGVLAVEEYSDEWLPRPVVLEAASGGEAPSAPGEPLRTRWWPYLLGILALGAEWFSRRRLGLR